MAQLEKRQEVKTDIPSTKPFGAAQHKTGDSKQLLASGDLGMSISQSYHTAAKNLQEYLLKPLWITTFRCFSFLWLNLKWLSFIGRSLTYRWFRTKILRKSGPWRGVMTFKVKFE